MFWAQFLRVIMLQQKAVSPAPLQPANTTFYLVLKFFAWLEN